VFEVVPALSMHTLKEQIRNFDWSLKSIVKVSVAIVVVVITLAIVIAVLKFVTNGIFGYENRYYGDGLAQNFAGELIENLGFDSVATTKAIYGREGSVADVAMVEPGFVPLPPYEQGGPDAEEYERRSYSARYETRKFEETCTAINNLKPLDYVVFDNSSKSERWCNYTFRVEVEYEDEIVAKLQALDPRDFDINTSSVERGIKYADSELEMQRRRLESTQQTLAQAEASFNSLIARATREGDTATLSEVINNKIATIERLNQQILDTQERIDRLSKGRGEQIEQVEYAHFNVSVSKVMFLDGELFADEWRQRVQELFVEINAALLALTVGLVSFLLAAIQFVIFAALTIVGLAVFAKIAWVFIKKIWHWRSPRAQDGPMQ
tara:strand:+ start:13496 stop:14638 length:1143 start_codon:yes stop_codon:yes gene_type:complete